LSENFHTLVQWPFFCVMNTFNFLITYLTKSLKTICVLPLQFLTDLNHLVVCTVNSGIVINTLPGGKASLPLKYSLVACFFFSDINLVYIYIWIAIFSVVSESFQGGKQIRNQRFRWLQLKFWPCAQCLLLNVVYD